MRWGIAYSIIQSRSAEIAYVNGVNSVLIPIYIGLLRFDTLSVRLFHYLK
jgi:hypothetical protein